MQNLNLNLDYSELIDLIILVETSVTNIETDPILLAALTYTLPRQKEILAKLEKLENLKNNS